MSLAASDPFERVRAELYERPGTTFAPKELANEPQTTESRWAEAHRRYLLLLRFAVINLAGFGLVGAAWQAGWIDAIAAGDASRVSLVIALTFLAGLAICGVRVARVSSELNGVLAGTPAPDSWAEDYLLEIADRRSGSRAITAGSVRMRLASRIAIVRQMANSLVLLGLIGTVVGFVIALSGVDPSTAADVHAIAPMVGELIRGMSVALYTTLVGAVLNLWLTVNYQLLHGGAVRLAAKLIALGETNNARQRSV